MRAKRSLRRSVRYYVAVVLKFTFLFVMSIEAILDGLYWLAGGLIELLGFRCLLDLSRRIMARFDEWLLTRSTSFVYVVVGILLAVGCLIELYKIWLFANGEIRFLFWFSVADKFTYVIVVKHLLYVYRELLLSSPKIRRIYERCAAIRAAAVASVLNTTWYRDAIAMRALIREEWDRYSILAFAKRKAGGHHCCLLAWGT